ncbi:hypothetical protein, partial [Pseudomonas sp. NBRC 111142]|uniref:hypothetical protein n=1 Tax=Pseudomonas sp. NBRC 111142 TaxID=1661057 RepID=UPI000AF79936
MFNMPITLKIEARDFYRDMPSIDHETGDIWNDLPGMALPYNNNNMGIVISPACDLSQRKTETVTLIPIIPIHDYFYSKAFYSEIWNEFYGRLKALGADNASPPNRFSHPPTNFILSTIQNLEGNNKQSDLRRRLIAYRDYIEYTEASPDDRSMQRPSIEAILTPQKTTGILKKIFCNAFKSDIHFFPAYKTSSNFTTIPSHSVALFRYVYSIPIEILESAQASREEWWEEDRRRLTESTPLIDHFQRYPIKISRLKDDFLTDLLSRYLSMFMRLGSRDFTKATIDDFATDMKGL